ncbi:UNVERIFIED_CONTAM: Signal recognition particle protein, partial [Sesamum latifolium]
CIKFKTDQAQDAKKMEKLNNVFFTLMARDQKGLEEAEVGEFEMGIFQFAAVIV